MRVRETIVHFLDEDNKVTENWSTRSTGDKFMEYDEEDLFEIICKKDGLDLSEKFLIEVKGYRNSKTYYFYNEGRVRKRL